MFDQARSSLRPIGVRTEENHSTEQAPTMTIVGISDVEWKYMKWGDESGRAHEGLVLMARDVSGNPVIFYPPNTESWFKNCKPFSVAIQEQFARRLRERDSAAADSSAVPESDSVSILEVQK